MFLIFDKMADVGHFGCPKFTFDCISGHFRSICNFNIRNFFLDGTTMSIIEYNYTCHKSKVFLHVNTYHSMKNILEHAKNGGLSMLYDTGFSDPSFCGMFLNAMAVPHALYNPGCRKDIYGV